MRPTVQQLRQHWQVESRSVYMLSSLSAGSSTLSRGTTAQLRNRLAAIDKLACIAESVVSVSVYVCVSVCGYERYCSLMTLLGSSASVSVCEYVWGTW